MTRVVARRWPALCNTAVEEEVLAALSPEIAVLSLSAAVIAFMHTLLASLEWLEGLRGNLAMVFLGI